MISGNFQKYLTSLNFTDKDISSFIEGNIFKFSPHPQAPAVKYILVESENTEREIFKYHLELWNQNNDNAFIAVASQKTYIINLKSKPDRDAVLKSATCIKSFDYGVNSDGYKDIALDIISKDNITSTGFYQFLAEKQRNKQEVDKDLLLNLIALRNDMMENGNEQVIHLLILRCLFVKYLEDRKVFPKNFLPDILKNRVPRNLINAFSEVCKINGDVFGENMLTEKDIKPEYMSQLYLFFTTDYKSGQGTLFPYLFDNIPIQLISHVYEAFLKSDTKKNKGIYYTPTYIVDFMLSQSLKKIVKDNSNLKILDPAVGSGAFLVESFKIIRDSYVRKLSFDEKKHILENQLFGIDIDNDALQITAFSLYLALLEDESHEFIKHEIEHSHPILPSLIGKTLIKANSIVDSVFEGEIFDFIVSNPPWGSVPGDDNADNIMAREAIDDHKAFPEYESVADYERSQAFLARIARWRHEKTLTVMIVKNSIFLNDHAKDFRRDFLEKNQIGSFYELSHYNKVLFKKRVIGTVKEKSVEIGASEPCAIVIYKRNTGNANYIINYISPRLTTMGEHFELIQYTANESFLIEKQEFVGYDMLWRILVNGDYECYKMIAGKIFTQRELEIEAKAGFQPKKNMRQLGTPIWKNLIEPNDFEAFYQANQELRKFNWNQELHRKRNENIYLGHRLLIPVKPLKKDHQKLRAVHLEKEIVCSDNIIIIKLKNNGKEYIDTYSYAALFNSKLLSFYFYQISAQWGKGEGKRAKLRNSDIESLPIKCINDKYTVKLNRYIEDIIKLRSVNQNADDAKDKIDELVFNLYGLTKYEKEIIKEFYEVNVERASAPLVRQKDIENYFSVFKETFLLMFHQDYSINAVCSISANIGAIIKISIVNKKDECELGLDNTLQILQFVKNKQLNETDKLLKEEKIKIYDPPSHFYLIKSNQFKDWTRRQAIKDAKEEIGELLSNLPDTHE